MHFSVSLYFSIGNRGKIITKRFYCLTIQSRDSLQKNNPNFSLGLLPICFCLLSRSENDNKNQNADLTESFILNEFWGWSNQLSRTHANIYKKDDIILSLWLNLVLFPNLNFNQIDSTNGSESDHQTVFYYFTLEYKYEYFMERSS